MSLAIGFTNKYFTLWNVYSREETVGDVNSWTTYTVTNRYFIQNLSMDLESARKKAKEMGCKNLIVDEELHGVSQSWSSKEVKESYSNPELFKFGRYKGTRIDETLESEIDYLLWYLSEQSWEKDMEHISYIRKFLVDEFGFVNILGKTPNETESIFRTKKEANAELEAETLHYIKEDFLDSCYLKTSLVGTLIRNVNDCGYGFLYVQNEKADIEVDLCVHFEDIKANWYNGFEYYLPIDSKGKAKKVKNKTIEVFGQWKYSEEQGLKTFYVNDFKVL